MKILQLNAENVKRLKAVEITTDGKAGIVMVGGDNAQGKSSVLDSIMMALAGKSAQGVKPVRDGEDKATIELDIGEYIVKRTITEAGGGTITVTSKDGAKYPSPQKLLDGISSNLTFDPLVFMGQSKKEQLETLKKLLNINFSEIDLKRIELFNKRTDLNRDIKRQEALKNEIKYNPDVKGGPIVMADLMAGLAEVNNNNKKIEQLNNRYDVIERELMNIDEKIEELKNKKKILENEKDGIDLSFQTLKEMDPKPIQEQMMYAEAVNNQLRLNQEYDKLQTQIDDMFFTSDSITAAIEKIDKTKEDVIANAKLPVKGLALGEDCVLFNGIPLDQASSAEKLKISLAMGIALNPSLRIMLIRDGSLLDKNNMKMLGDMAKTNDMQVWIEVVGARSECSVVIEDGEVKK